MVWDLSIKPQTSNLEPQIKKVGESEQGRLVDALAPGGDEGRDKLR